LTKSRGKNISYGCERETNHTLIVRRKVKKNCLTLLKEKHNISLYLYETFHSTFLVQFNNGVFFYSKRNVLLTPKWISAHQCFEFIFVSTVHSTSTCSCSVGLIIFSSTNKLKTQHRYRIQASAVLVLVVTLKMLPVTLCKVVKRI
jgi:hypothetical protein